MNWEKQKRFLNFVTKVGFLIMPISIIGSIIGFNIGDGNFMATSFFSGMAGSIIALSCQYVVTMTDALINKMNKDNTSIEFLGKECNDMDNEFEKQEIYVLSSKELGLEKNYANESYNKTNDRNDTLSYPDCMNEEHSFECETIENKPKVRSIGTKK